MKNLIPVFFVLIATAGCQERPEDREVARAGEAPAVQGAPVQPMESNRDGREARQTAGPAAVNGMPHAANRGEADYAMAASHARAAHAAARQKCDAMTGESRSRCESTAGAGYEAALADAAMNRTRSGNQATLPPLEDSSQPLRQQ